VFSKLNEVDVMNSQNACQTLVVKWMKFCDKIWRFQFVFSIWQIFFNLLKTTEMDGKRSVSCLRSTAVFKIELGTAYSREKSSVNFQAPIAR